MDFESPERVPRFVSALPGVVEGRSAEYQDLLARYPSDAVFAAPSYRPSKRTKGSPHSGEPFVDEWGSVWGAEQAGMIGEVKQPVLADWDDLKTLEAPLEMLDGADVEAANRVCAETSQYPIAAGMIRPFERMQFIRGPENLYVDLALGEPGVLKLRDLVHTFHLRDLEWMLRIDADAVFFMDDWGSQQSLLISPAQWREIFKPLYREYCERIHAAGKKVFMHSDGHIEAIYPDLIEIGVDALNSQLFVMDIERLGRDYGGRITFWGEIDRQHLLPFGEPEAVAEAVRRVRRALDSGRGGVVAQCEWGLRDPLENIEAVYRTWTEPHPDPARRYPAEVAAGHPA